MAVSPKLPSWSQCEPACIRLQALDLRNIQVIAQVLAQSVALDFYSRQALGGGAAAACRRVFQLQPAIQPPPRPACSIVINPILSVC